LAWNQANTPQYGESTTLDRGFGPERGKNIEISRDAKKRRRKSDRSRKMWLKRLLAQGGGSRERGNSENEKPGNESGLLDR